MLPASRDQSQRAKIRELVAIALFIASSTVAVRGFDLFPPLSAHAREILGPAPSQGMLSLALIVYSFSAIILSLARMMGNALKTGGIAHAGYLGAFYVFYHLSGVLPENFWAVFAAGVTIFSLESYQIWSYNEDEETEL
ncbi:menaquinol oxidoreductase [Geomonas sp. RF6]|uniref:menaquinol oxidoreductase n=1 Tax=Geomonas sp. RF6 TaxID=2897342 RepID=UPI001E4FBA1E|nr:menaquinol oxidoreductase [Geomonas sp. RF6]UFS71535.1 menaquinol oxidoreductase [Geomonas sp. RF6]